MEQLYELVVEGDERLVATEEPVEVGDVLIVEDEVLLVLRESDAAAPGRRYECRRALQLRNRAQELLAYTRELELKFAEAREVRRSLTNR